MTEIIQISSLDHHFADFIHTVDCNPSDDLWLAAALASNAAGRGDTCLDMSATANWSVVPFSPVSRKLHPPEISLWRIALEGCDTVGAPGDYTPLVMDDVGRLYLHRSWEYERMVAEGILLRNRRLHVDPIFLTAALDHYFPVPVGTQDLQRDAALLALTRSFSVISGGPGTGKTATVARILVLLIELSSDIRPDIALAAPTGKAAMRLCQSVRRALERLDLSPGIRNRLPDDVSTIHRLLGVKGSGGEFRYNRDNRLPYDVLVVDEASMIDLPLMANLLEAVRDDARIILLGDRDQLASVEAGAVLADICAGGSLDRVPVTQLTKSYRFGHASGIGALSRLINAGDGTAAFNLLTSGIHPDLVWRSLPSERFFEEDFADSIRDGYSGYARSLSPEEALNGLDRFRVLSPLRSGMYGVENLNKICCAALNLKRMSDEQLYRLMPVMMTANNYELELFNGDTGVVMEKDGQPSVWFSSQGDAVRHLSHLRLPPHETAFALTVHKSQGSEFDTLLLILPDHISKAVSRELLYTAVTRARNRVEIWGSAEVFLQAVEQRRERNTGLGDRLRRGDAS